MYGALAPRIELRLGNAASFMSIFPVVLMGGGVGAEEGHRYVRFHHCTAFPRRWAGLAELQTSEGTRSSSLNSLPGSPSRDVKHDEAEQFIDDFPSQNLRPSPSAPRSPAQPACPAGLGALATLRNIAVTM